MDFAHSKVVYWVFKSAPFQWFSSPPTALDGVIFAVIRRIVSEHDFKIIFVSKLGQALHKLGPQWLLFADEGQLKKSQLQEQANQDSALTLVTNAIIVWNTVYMQAVIDQLKQEGYVINESDLQHISPCRFEHLNKHGKLAFNVDTTWRLNSLRPLRDPSED